MHASPDGDCPLNTHNVHLKYLHRKGLLLNAEAADVLAAPKKAPNPRPSGLVPVPRRVISSDYMQT